MAKIDGMIQKNNGPEPFKPGKGQKLAVGSQRYSAGEGSRYTPGASVARPDFEGIKLTDHPTYGKATGHNRDHLSGEWVVEAGAVAVRSRVSAQVAADLWETAVKTAAAKP